jgi:hypothetical protein
VVARRGSPVPGAEQVDEIAAAANLSLDKHDIATILRRK